jgi:hypothetical protein
MYELAKAFRAKRPDSREKAIPLFSYLEEFVKFHILCVKQVPDLLREEIKAADGRFTVVECFYRDENFERVSHEIKQLAAGRVDPRFDLLFKLRTGQVSEFRAQAPARSAKWSKFIGDKREVALDEFMQFGLRERADGCLRIHISKFCTEFSSKDVKRLARKILAARRFRLAQALVRADLYLDWLCFRGRAIARDTLDDCYHIENAAYCDVYATDESSQDLYANEILSLTKVSVHDRKSPLLEWLNTTAISG